MSDTVTNILQLQPKEWQKEFKKKYRHRYTKASVGKAVMATYMWARGNSMKGIQDGGKLFSEGEISAFTIIGQSDPITHEKFVRHRLAADWCYDHAITGIIQGNALRSCLSDYATIIRQCLLGQVLLDMVDEYPQHSIGDKAKLLLQQYSLPDYLYGDSCGAFAVMRSNIRTGIRYILIHNAVMQIIGRQVKMGDAAAYFSIGLDRIQEQIDELNQSLAFLYETTKTKSRYTDTEAMAAHLKRQLRPVVFEQEPIPKQALAHVAAQVKGLQCFVGNASPLVTYLIGVYGGGVNANDKD